MKEININIEGFNENGICVGCLNYNRKMFRHENVKSCFKLLADIDVPDGLDIQVCWECYAAIRNISFFQKQILKSFNYLLEYSQKQTFLNSPTDLSQYSTQRLSSTNLLESINCDESSQMKSETPSDDIKVKLEDSNLIRFDRNNDDLLEDDATVPLQEMPVVLDDLKIEQDYEDINYSDGIDMFPDPVTSDDDIQLSKLSKKKEKKGKKKKKIRSKIKSTEEGQGDEGEPVNKIRQSRRMKNLPEDLVQLFTMDEEEMWKIRAQDLASKEFTKRKYRCDDCIIGFNTQKLMNDHMNGKHKPKSADCEQCDICKAYFLTKDNLSTHKSLHLVAFSCTACAYRSGVKRSVAEHCAAHRRAPPQQCAQCGERFATRSKLNYHRNVTHQSKPQCDCCGKVFANKMTLKYHLKLLPQNKPKAEKVYIECKGCNKVFTSKKSYRAHVVIHDGLSYPCTVCGKLFQWKRNLARHMRNHRDKEVGTLHECKECGKTFSSRDCYNNHMKLSKRHMPEQELSHECSYCGKKFAAKWCMVDHIDWDHLKRIKYQCSFCFKAFKTHKIMTAHVDNIHGNKKNNEPDGEHLCDVCGKSYKTVKRLKSHVWSMHTNRSTKKSFKCKLCAASFTWQTSIYKHVKMMHDNKRNKPARPLRPVKKQESYMENDMSRMQYFQQNPTASMAPQLGIVMKETQPFKSY